MHGALRLTGVSLRMVNSFEGNPQDLAFLLFRLWGKVFAVADGVVVKADRFPTIATPRTQTALNLLCTMTRENLGGNFVDGRTAR